MFCQAYFLNDKKRLFIKTNYVNHLALIVPFYQHN